MLLFCLLVFLLANVSSGADEHGICKSVDVRNSIDAFQKLNGCRVVEGFVQILLFDAVDEEALAHVKFPELVEITDYLLLYRVNGLKSIGRLFPNLSVIRGQRSFYRYSLVVFEMSTLQEIALHSLLNITNGYVRIDKNPSLCFIKTIDWSRILTDTDGDQNYIFSSKPDDECPTCPGDNDHENDVNAVAGISKSCPLAPYASRQSPTTRRLCWNAKTCQRVCAASCGGAACNDLGKCCPEQCLGGCDRNGECKVCGGFEVFSSDGKGRKCVKACPPGTLEFLDRRCITEAECKTMPRPIYLPNSEPLFPYNIYQNKCILKCPVNMNVDRQTCVPCEEGKCRKACNGVNVDSIETARQLTGCTKITGSLEIQIRGGSNVVYELEKSLGMLEEIEGYLKIVRSFPLVSLNFLRSLRRIGGKTLDGQKYSFVVLDNQNLQDLWDWKEDRSLRIENGRLFFHFNPKLCLEKIRRLQEKTGLYPPFTELEVANNSNGDKIACDVTELVVKVKNVQSKAVSLSWQPFRLDDQRNLLGYIVYSIRAKYKNLTMYDGRDACGGDGWRVDDVTIPEDHNQEVVHLLTQLKPYTQYAFYVKTYTIAKENNGAQSPIRYFRTAPAVPSAPLKLTVTSDSSDSLKITWLPPKYPNGNITRYLVVGRKRQILKEGLNTRNHCSESNLPTSSEPPLPPPKIENANPNNGTCSCDDKVQKEPGINEDIQIERINFENALHNEVYIRKEPIESRKRRDLYPTFPTRRNQMHTTENQRIGNVTENGTDILESFERTIFGKTELRINKLKHYAYYDVHVQACREKEGNKDEDLCSFQAVESGRTLVKPGADDVKKVWVINRTLESVTIKWDELKEPNGMIFKYMIEYKKNGENVKTSIDCVTHSEWLKLGKIYTLRLPPGNYTLRVLAATAGNSGKYSPYIHFRIDENNDAAIALIAAFLPVLILVIFVAFFCRKRGEKKGMLLNPSINPEYMTYLPDEWEIPRHQVELGRELGQGTFGMVYEGKLLNFRGEKEVKCAVKTVNEHSTERERLEFLNEAAVMKSFDAYHVVRLLGVVSASRPALVVMELMELGDLKSYLRSQRPLGNPHTLRMACEIADGMAYLASRKFVHRDLAARNCMVTERLVAKVGDFGMTRDVYETDYYRKGSRGLLPVRWMAPESLRDGVFTSKSDVWSYGVVLWEAATLAAQPYQGMSNEQVLRYVVGGGLMERPENCSDKLYNLMSMCWHVRPARRPSFMRICEMLMDETGPEFKKVAFCLDRERSGVEEEDDEEECTDSEQDQERDDVFREFDFGDRIGDGGTDRNGGRVLENGVVNTTQC